MWKKSNERKVHGTGSAIHVCQYTLYEVLGFANLKQFKEVSSFPIYSKTCSECQDLQGFRRDIGHNLYVLYTKKVKDIKYPLTFAV